MAHRPKVFRTAGQAEASAQARRDYDARRLRESETRALYKTMRWQRVRQAQLNEQPLCEMCLDRDKVTAATVCHHRIPHRGDVVRFWSGPFGSLCDPCHNSEGQRQDREATPIRW